MLSVQDLSKFTPFLTTELSFTHDTEIIEHDYIEYFFGLVEQTKFMHNETFNYSVIKFIVSDISRVSASHCIWWFLPDCFKWTIHGRRSESWWDDGGSIETERGRLGSMKSFGENMIFILNRAREFWTHQQFLFFAATLLYYLCSLL